MHGVDFCMYKPIRVFILIYIRILFIFNFTVLMLACMQAQNSSEPAKKSALQQAKEMVGRLKGSVDKKTVSALFSGKSGSRSLAKRAPVTAFDPAADLLVADKKRKKQNTKPRPITITVVLLPYVQKSIPKGQQRKALEKEGRVQKIQVHRYASEDDIKVLIATTFSEVCPNLQDWMVLESSSRNQLSIIEQSLTAEYVIERRGGLYLAEATMNVSICMYLHVHNITLLQLLNFACIVCCL